MEYWISQIFVLFAYIMCGATFFVKKREYVLFLSTGVCASFSVAYVFLSAWTGIAMNIVSIIRNIMFFLVAKYASNNKKLNYLQLGIIMFLTAICALITYDGILSLAAVFASAIYSYAVWNEKSKYYKIYAILSSLAWIVYNFFIKSILGIILEAVMVICAIIGLIKNKNKGYEGEESGKNLLG